MNPLKLFRKAVKFIRGGGGPLQILLACILGMMLGMVPGFHLTAVLLVLAIVALNVSIGLAMFCMVIGKGVQLLLAPVVFHVGHFLIHGLGLEGFIRWAGDTPVVALLDLHVYAVPGGLVLGLAGGLAVGIPAAMAIVGVRRSLVAAVDKHAALQKLSLHPAVRVLIRVLFGKAKQTLAETLAAHPPIVRKGGVIVAAVLGLLVVGGAVAAVDHVLPSRLAGLLGAANGAQVDLARADLSLLGGRLRLDGLQVTDRSKPTHNVLSADRLEATISVLDLLAKRVVLDRVEVTGARSDSVREVPGAVYPREAQADDGSDEGVVLTDYFEDIETYRKYEEYLRQLRDYLRKQERKSTPRTPDDLRRDAEARGYLALSAREVLTRHPAVVIRELVIDRITLAGSDVSYRLEGRQISTDPSRNPEVMSLLWGDVPAEGAAEVGGRRKLRVGLDPAAGGQYQVELRLADVPVEGLSRRVPVQVERGKAVISAQGVVSAAAMAVQMVIDVTDLESSAQPGQSVLGLSAETSATVFRELRQLRLVGSLLGPIDRPRLQLDERATLEYLKAALGGAAKAELLSRIDERLGALAPGLPIRSPEEFLRAPTSLPTSLPAGLPNLLAPPPAEGEPKDSPARRLLDGLRK